MPEFPAEGEHLWNCFTRLARRRGGGIAPNPLTYQDIEAFERKTFIRLSAWETDVIVRLDDAVLSVWAKGAKQKPPADGPSEPISVGDTASMKALFRGLATRKRQELASKKGGAHD